MLDSLDQARDGKTIAHLLDDLSQFLTLHFAGEESPGGFFDTVASRHTTHAARLREEHRVFLETIARLRANPQLERAPSNILGDVADLVLALRAHEALEEDLLVDSMKSDLGGGE
jgi:hypothetical protein